MQPLSLQLLLVFTSCILAGFCIAAQSARMTNLPSPMNCTPKSSHRQATKTWESQDRATLGAVHRQDSVTALSLMAVLTGPYKLCTQLPTKSNAHWQRQSLLAPTQGFEASERAEPWRHSCTWQWQQMSLKSCTGQRQSREQYSSPASPNPIRAQGPSSAVERVTFVTGECSYRGWLLSPKCVRTQLHFLSLNGSELIQFPLRVYFEVGTWK